MIETNLGSLRIETAGSGPPAILWHSLFLDNHQWDRVLSDLTQTRSVVAIEGPGHGGSNLAASQFTLDDCATAAVQIMDRLEIAKADWVGNAWGGHVGIATAAQHPARLASLITIG